MLNMCSNKILIIYIYAVDSFYQFIFEFFIFTSDSKNILLAKNNSDNTTIIMINKGGFLRYHVSVWKYIGSFLNNKSYCSIGFTPRIFTPVERTLQKSHFCNFNDKCNKLVTIVRMSFSIRWSYSQ